MKSSIFPLIILLVVCFGLSFIVPKNLHYSESFKLTADNGEEYELNEDEELYNVDGTLEKGPHDSTDYASLLDNVKDSYEELRNKPAVKCNESIKCIADFGTNVGQDLCCGQTGVLQDTRYVCPSNKPTCTKFKCGSTFGTCS
jgi:hypothetical protein